MVKSSGNKRFRVFRSPEACLFLLLVAAIGYVLVQWHHLDREEWNLPERMEAGIAEAPSAGSGGRNDTALLGPPVRFMAYNVCNYFVEGDPKRSTYDSKPKQEESRNAVADGIMEVAPGMVGLSEIGGKAALVDLQARLKSKGLDLPHSFVLERNGEDRALAFLSAWPIAENRSQTEIVLDRKGRRMLRGILDVTVRLSGDRAFRFVGVHLKSKRDDDGTAEQVRRLEAHALYDYLTSTRTSVPLVLYGDFNDGPDSAVVRTVLGPGRGPESLRRLTPRDSRKESWTLYYARGQAYFSYDHLILNRAMSARLGRSPKCGVVDRTDFLKAGDHRPVWVDLR